MKQDCRNCRFVSEAIEGGEERKILILRCRRFPPTWTSSKVTNSAISNFPITWETWNCGEWRAK